MIVCRVYWKPCYYFSSRLATLVLFRISSEVFLTRGNHEDSRKREYTSISGVYQLNTKNKSMSSDFLKPNSTQVPNIIIDKLMYRLPDAEFRVVIYICRRTYGFQRESDQISFSQFIDGIVKRDGTRLDGGCGLSRQSVSKALNSLTEMKLIIKEENARGNIYKINLDVDLKEVVKLLDQSSNHTGSGLPSRPKVVKVVDQQKKVTKQSQNLSEGSDDGVSEEEEKFELKSEIDILDKSNSRHLVIIGGYLDYVYDRVKENITTKKQFNSFIKANVKVASDLANAGYTDHQLTKAFDSVRRKYEGKIDWKLSTVHKELTS